MKKKCRFSLCAAILIVFISVSLAYVLLGYKWPVGSTEPYRINENTAQVADERNAVVSAMSSWNGINPSGLTLSYAGSTSVITYSYNGSNTVCWNNLGATGALATAYMWYSGSTMVETDVVFNDFYTWSTSGGNYDVQTVALHELGHCVGLNHSSRVEGRLLLFHWIEPLFRSLEQGKKYSRLGIQAQGRYPIR